MEELPFAPTSVRVLMVDEIRFNKLDEIEEFAEQCNGYSTGGGYLIAGGSGEMNADRDFDFPTMYHAARFINFLKLKYTEEEVNVAPYAINGDFLREGNKVWKMIGY